MWFGSGRTTGLRLSGLMEAVSGFGCVMYLSRDGAGWPYYSIARCAAFPVAISTVGPSILAA
jgi:hypothetical protein